MASGEEEGKKRNPLGGISVVSVHIFFSKSPGVYLFVLELCCVDDVTSTNHSIGREAREKEVMYCCAH